MGRFKALLLKEYWTHKKSVWSPLFIQLGLVIATFILLSITVAHNYDSIQDFRESTWQNFLLSKKNAEQRENARETIEEQRNRLQGYMDNPEEYEFTEAEIEALHIAYNNIIDLPDNPVDIPHIINSSFYMLPWIITIPFYWIIIIVLAIRMERIVNSDWKTKCILFHSSLPVSSIQRSFSKIIFGLGTSFISIILFALINNFIIIGFLMWVIPDTSFAAPLLYNFIAQTQFLFLCLSSAFIILGFCYFCAALTKENSVPKSIIAVMVLVGIVSWSYVITGKTSIFLEFFLKFYRLHFPNINNDVFTNNIIQKWGYASIPMTNTGLEPIIAAQWTNFFSRYTLLQILVGVAYFGVGMLLIKKREVV